MVVYGIYVVWRDIKGVIHTALDNVNDAASTKFCENSDKISELVKILQQNNRRLYSTIEFIILAVGTIISAYGELLNEFHS